jgi:hypothetical protein
LQVFVVQPLPLVHDVPFAAAHVLVVVLHRPVRQTAAASEQAPVWYPSFGIALPAFLFATHVKVLRSQYCVAVLHSEST